MTPIHDPTQLLIEKAREGDREAFEALVESHRERLTARVEPRVGKHLLSRVTVEDILQETLTVEVTSTGNPGEFQKSWPLGEGETKLSAAQWKIRSGATLSINSRVAMGSVISQSIQVTSSWICRTLSRRERCQRCTPKTSTPFDRA